MSQKQYRIKVEFENTDQVETKERCLIEHLVNTAVELLRDCSGSGIALDQQKGAS